MARIDTLDNFLTDVADAIREKTGSEETIFASEFDNLILDIPSGGSGGVEEKDVNFYDYEGNLVGSYFADEVYDWLFLPDPPTHEGMEFQGWNWKLQDIKNYLANHETEEGVKLEVGETCCTDDGTTRIYMNLPSELLQPTLGLFTTGDVQIDWGDDTEPETITCNGNETIKTVSHRYEYDGRYTIILTPTNTLYLNSQNDVSALILNDPNEYTSYSRGVGYRSCVEKIELGEDVIIGDKGLTNLCFTSVNLPVGSKTIITSYDFQYSFLKYITIPKGVTNINSYSFQYSYLLHHVSLPAEVKVIGVSAFNSCALKRITLPDGITTIGESAFRNCTQLEGITLPQSVTSLGKYSIANTSLLCIKFPNTYTTLSQYTFQQSGDRMAKIIIPANVTNIPNYFCSLMNGLNKLVFNGAITSIGANAITNCYSLKYIDFTGCNTVPSVSSNSFASLAPNYKIIVPHSLYDTWVATSGWSSYTSNIVDENNI